MLASRYYSYARDVVSNIMKILHTLLISLISLTLCSQNEPFQLYLYQDTITVNKFDTIFSYRIENREIIYNNGFVQIERINGEITTSYKVKIKSFRKDSLHKLSIAELASHGRHTTTDNKNGKVIYEGNLINGRQVGVWYDRTNEFDLLNVYDSSGVQLPLVKYKIDTVQQLIFIREIDTSTFTYSLKNKLNLIVNPENYFRSESNYVDAEDTSRFCILNLHMDTLGFQSYKSIKYDFIRFIWFRPQNPINLNIRKEDTKVIYDLIVTDAEYDFNLGKIIQKENFSVSNIKEFERIENRLDKLNFWEQASKDQCYGDYLFIEAKINDKYNSKRINCLEYQLSENKPLIRMLKKLYKQTGLENEYKIKK